MLGEFYQPFREELTPTLLKIFQKISEEHSQAHSMRLPLITLKQKPEKKKENYWPILLTNIHTNILNKILANEVQQHIKRIIHHDHMGFTSGIQGFLTYVN